MAQQEAASDAASKVMADIIDGKSAQLPIARYHASRTGPAASLVKPNTRAADASDLQAAQSELVAALEAMAKHPGDKGRARLTRSYEQWKAHILIVRARFDSDEERLKANASNASFLAAHQRVRTSTLATFARVEALLDPLLVQDPKSKTTDQGTAQAVQASLDILRALPSAPVDVPILRANAVPFGSLALPARQPDTANPIVPSYERPTETVPSADSLSGTVAAPLNDEIVAKAKSLNNDYVKIYEFVRNGIRTKWYAGSIKGALGTLRSGEGNDTDQASLLTALLRAAGLSTNYVQGVVELPVDAIASELGLPAGQASLVPSALTKAGVAFTSVSKGGQITAVRVARTWVSAQVPYTNYRGALIDSSGKTWIPLDAAYKTTKYTPASGQFSQRFSAVTLETEYLSRPSLQDFFTFASARFQSALDSAGMTGGVDAQAGLGVIQPLKLDVLPNTLPYQVHAVTFEAPDLPTADKATVRLRLRAGTQASSTLVLDKTIDINEAVNSRLTLSYGPASLDDHRVALLYGGMDNVPLYLIGLRPHVKLGGAIVASGIDKVEAGSSLRLEVDISGPWGVQTVVQTVYAGAYHALVLGDTPTPLATAADDGEYLGAKLMTGLGKYYSSRWTEADAKLAAWQDVAVVRPVPALTVVSTSMRPSLVAGVPVTLEWRGVSIDAALRPVDAIGAKASDFLKLSALGGSSLESAVFREQFQVEAVSADRGLQIAAEEGIEVLTLTDASAAGLNNTTHPESVKAAVKDLTRQGYTVRLPARPIALEAWEGSVWQATDRAQAGYFIAGGLAGGETAMLPQMWTLSFLADAFAAMNGESPVNDPLAGVEVVKFGVGDYQDATVGKQLPAALGVQVLDKEKRPVKGAQVTYFIHSGDASFGDGAKSITLITNGAGVASTFVTLGTSTYVNSAWAKLNPKDKYTTQIGRIVVDVTVDSAKGPLRPSQPFTAYSVPGPLSDVAGISGTSGQAMAGEYVALLKLKAQDQHGNPIANVDTQFSISSTPGGCRNANGEGFEQGKLIDWQTANCTATVIGHCGSPTVQKSTFSDGMVAAGVILGNGLTGSTTVTTNSSGRSKTFTYQSSDDCGDLEQGEWAYIETRRRLVDGQGNTVSAGKPGEVYDYNWPVEMFYMDNPYFIGDRGYVDYRPYRKFVKTDGIISGIDVSNGGSAENIQGGGGSYTYKVRTGGEPGENSAGINARITYIYRRQPTGAYGEVKETKSTVGIRSNGALVVGVKPVIDSIVSQNVPSGTLAERVYLDANGISLYPIEVSYTIQPADFKVSYADVGIYLGNTWIDSSPGTPTIGSGKAILPRGLVMDPRSSYQVKLTAVIEGEGKDIPLRQKLIGSMSPQVYTSRYVDEVNRRVCHRPGVVYFSFTQPVIATLSYQMLDATGQALGSPQQLFKNKVYAPGEASHELDPSKLGSGKFVLTLDAVDASDPSTVDTATGNVDVRYQIANTLPVGQVLVKGVNVRSGTLTHQTPSLSIPGRGPAFSFYASYSSAGPGDVGNMGVNWSHNLDLGLSINSCGEVNVAAGDSGSVRFFPTSDGTMVPDKGYHGTLVANLTDKSWDFYSKDGTNYHYKFMNDRVQWKIDKITDRQGNTLTFEYDDTAFPEPLLSKVVSSDGREFKLIYEGVAITNQSSKSPKPSLLKEVKGPSGTSATLSYDGFGNLTGVKVNNRQHKYAYSIAEPEPADRHRLTSSEDPNGNLTAYTYNKSNLKLQVPEVGEVELPHLVVERVGVPGGGNVGISIDPARWSQSTVTNELGGSTLYTFNAYGSPTAIQEPSGTTRMTWAEDDVLMTSRTDANGVNTTYTHDAAGNVKSEQTGSYSITYTYEIQGSAPFSKSRRLSMKDRNGGMHTYRLDGKGNVVAEELPEGVTIRHTYAGNGDRMSTTDGRGKQTRFEYDGYGNEVAATNAEGIRTETQRDGRGRVTRIVDGKGGTSVLAYDASDNLVSIRNPAGKTRRFSHDSNGNKLSETDESSVTTSWTYNAQDLPVTMKRAGASKSMDYDKAGNKTLESDWAGRATTYSFDSSSRLKTRTEPMGRVTTYTYDGVGNLKTETAPNGTTTHDYDALNRRTSTKDANNKTWSFGYDGNGNRTRATDPLSRATTMEYDGLNRLKIVTQPLGRSTSFGYDNSGNKTREIDANGNVTTHDYDGANRLTRTGHPDGTSVSYTYDANNNVVQQTDEGGGVSVFAFDALNRKTSAKDPAGHVTTYDYDELGNLTDETWPNGNHLVHAYDAFNRRLSTSDSIGLVGRWSYDDNGNITSETDGNGNSTGHDYNALNQRTVSNLPGGRVLRFKPDLMGNVLEATDARGNTIVTSYDPLNRPKQIRYPDGGQVDIGYDDVGNKVSETDPLGHATTYGYDALNRVETVTDPKSGVVRFTYDKNGNKLTEKDKRGTQTTHRYDTMNRLLGTTKAGIDIEALTYTALGKVATRTDANGNQTRYGYDKRGLQISENAPEGATTLTERDGMGDVTVATDAENRVTRSTYDKRRRLTLVTNPASEATSHEYDLANNKTATVRPLGGRTTYTFDNRNYMTVVTEPLSRVTRYEYDGNGNLITLTDANSRATGFGYDKRNRRNSVSYPGGASENMTLDAAGNLKTHTDAKAVTTSRDFDELNRETRRAYSSSTDGLQQVGTAYDANGNVLTVTEQYAGSTRTSTYSYDAFDRRQSAKDGFGAQMAFVYDANGNRKSLSTQDARITQYGYDKLNRLVTLTGPSGSVQYRRDRTDLLLEESWSNSLATTSTYDAASRPTRVQLAKAGQILNLTEYAYDANGNRTQERINRPSGAQLTTYRYDGADRLKGTARTQGGQTEDSSWTYDDVGNRLTEEVKTGPSGGSATSTVTRSYAYDARHQLRSITDAVAGNTQLSYDNQGNLTSKTQGGRVTGYTWNARDELVSVTVDGTEVGRYDTDHEGLRVSKQARDPLQPQGPVRVIRTQWDELNAVQDRDTSGNVVARYDFAGSRPVGLWSTADGSQLLHADVLGSIVATTAANDGSVKSETLYDAWGRQVEKAGASANKFAFTGQQWDAETGLYYYKARYYDASIGRFISQDPAEGKALEPASYHKYLYAYGNPTVFTDPDGREAIAGVCPICPPLPIWPTEEARKSAVESAWRLQIALRDEVKSWFTPEEPPAKSVPSAAVPVQSQPVVDEGVRNAILESSRRQKALDEQWARGKNTLPGKPIQSQDGITGEATGKPATEPMPQLPGKPGAKQEEGSIRLPGKGQATTKPTDNITWTPAENKATPLIIEQRRDAEGKFTSDKGEGEKAPGAASEEAVWDAIEAKKASQGWKVVRGRVYVTDETGQQRVYDGMVQTPRGKNIALEVKSGDARKTREQREFDKRVNSGENTAVGRGKNKGTTVDKVLEIRKPRE